MKLTPPTSDAAASILDNVPGAYVRFDSEFRYGFVNRAAEQLLGKSRADLLGKVLWDVYPEHALRGELPPCDGRARHDHFRGLLGTATAVVWDHGHTRKGGRDRRPSGGPNRAQKG